MLVYKFRTCYFQIMRLRHSLYSTTASSFNANDHVGNPSKWLFRPPPPGFTTTRRSTSRRETFQRTELPVGVAGASRTSMCWSAGDPSGSTDSRGRRTGYSTHGQLLGTTQLPGTQQPSGTSATHLNNSFELNLLFPYFASTASKQHACQSSTGRVMKYMNISSA
jgi:hypothetical protein